MFDAGVVFVDLIGVFLIVWLTRLVQHDRLYAGYAVIFIVVISVGCAALTIPVLLRPVRVLADVTARAPAAVPLALMFVTVMLIYVLSQTTLLSNRVTTLTQELALREAEDQRRSS